MNILTIQAPKAAQKVITIIHLALLAGQVLFGIIAVAVLHPAAGNRQNDKVFTYLVPLIAIVAVGISMFLFTQLIKKAIAQPTLQAKMTAYQTALIACYAPLEGASLFGIVAYIITGNLLYLLVSALLIARFVTIRPTVAKTGEDLKLSYDEQQELTETPAMVK